MYAARLNIVMQVSVLFLYLFVGFAVGFFFFWIALVFLLVRVFMFSWFYPVDTGRYWFFVGNIQVLLL